MDDVFAVLTRFALSPFHSATIVAEPEVALEAAGLRGSEVSLALSLSPSHLEAAGNGAWDSCDTCLDPGTDDDVEAP